MTDRPCDKCCWRGPDGCVKWDCEPFTRDQLKELLRERKEKNSD